MEIFNFLKSKKQVFILVCFLCLIFAVFLIFINSDEEKETYQDNSIEKSEEETGLASQKEIEKILKDENIDKDIREIIELAAISVEIPETSFDKIENAFNAGKITEEEAVIMTIQAVFIPENLSDEFRGVPIEGGEVEINADLQWIFDNLDNLSDEKREILEPFILPPDHPDSFFNPENKEKKNIIDSLSIIPIAKAANDWKTITFDAPNRSGAATIYYYAPDNFPESLNEQMKQKAIKVKNSFSKAWPMYKNLFGVEPSDPFKVHLSALNGGLNGLAVWDTSIDRCKLSVEENLTGKNLEATSIHELFHCFQFYVPLRFYRTSPDLIWLLEATAVWTENYVYPNYNTEHEYLDNFFKTLDQDRIFTNKKREYGSYMLFFFLTKYWGDESIVPKVLKKAVNGKIHDAVMDNIGSYEDGYAEFALYNWNRKPCQVYYDTPSFPNKSPVGNAVENLIIPEAMDFEYPVNLKKGAMKYIVHYFDDDIDKIKRVKFDFKTTTQDRKLQRQALIKIGDIWHIEDWNDITEREFCRKNPQENVKSIILIYSNSDLKNNKQAKYKLETKGDCPSKRIGYTRITEVGKTEGKSINFTYYSEDTVEYDFENDAYVITNRKMTCSSQDITNLKDVPLYGEVSGSIIGSGVLTESYEVGEDAPARFYLDEDGKGGSIIMDPDTKNPGWVTHTYNLVGGGPPFTEKSGCESFCAGSYDLEPNEITDKGIKGKRVLDVPSIHGTSRMTIEFEYELP